MRKTWESHGESSTKQQMACVGNSPETQLRSVSGPATPWEPLGLHRSSLRARETVDRTETHSPQSTPNSIPL